MKTLQVNNAPEGVCEDCGATVSDRKSGCRKLFEDVLVKDYSDYRYARVHRLMVDTYCLQHPDSFMRSGKSFAAHLTGVCSALEYEDSLSVNRTVQKWLSDNPK